MKKPYVILFLCLAPLFWAGNYVLGEVVVEEMPPLSMTYVRWLIAIVLLVPMAQMIEKPDWKSVLKAWKPLTLMALLGIIGYNFLLYESLRHTTPVNASLVNSISPILIVLFSTILLKERLTKSSAAGLIISFLGVILVLTNGELRSLIAVEFNAGDLIMLDAVVFWSIYSIMGRRMTGVPPIAATTVSVAIGLVLITPIIAFQGLPSTLSTAGMAGIIYMGIFPSVGAFVFWNISLRHVDASKVGIFLYLIPVFTALISLVMGRSITLIQLTGGLLVFIGVYLNSRK